MLAFHDLNRLTKTRRFVGTRFLRRSHASCFDAYKRFVAIIRHVRHADRERWARVPAHHVAVMLVDHFNCAVQLRIMNDAARFWIQINTVSTIREGLNAIAQFTFFRVIHFVDISIAKAADFDIGNVADVEIGVQSRGCFKLTVSFQFDFAGFAQLEASKQREVMRPQRTGLFVALQLERQNRAIIIFIMRFQRPLLVTGKTVSGQARLSRRTKPRPANRYATANRRAFF